MEKRSNLIIESSEPIIDAEEWRRTLNLLQKKVQTSSTTPMVRGKPEGDEEKRPFSAKQQTPFYPSVHQKHSRISGEKQFKTSTTRGSMVAQPPGEVKRKSALEPERKHKRVAEINRTHSLKQSLNFMQRENDKLRLKLQFSESIANQKSTVNKEMALPYFISTPSSRYESSLVNALKKKLRDTKIELDKCNSKIEILERNIKITKANEQTTVVLEYELECHRLREMLRFLIKSKHEGRPDCYEEIERKLLASQVQISEQQQLNSALNDKIILLEKSLKENNENSQIKLKEFDQNLKKQKSINKKNKESISKLKEEYRKLKEENKILQEMKNESNEMQADQVKTPKKAEYDEPDKEEEIDRLQTKLKELQKQQQNWDRQCQEKERELRELKVKYKQMEDSHILQHYEDEEKYTQKIVRLERQMECMKKEQAPTQKKKEEEKKPSGYPAEIPKKETYLDIVQEDDIEYAKQTLKNALLLHYKGIDKFKKKFYRDFSPEEKITIKELIKMFQRKPIKMQKKDAELLARYLIEARNSIFVAYNAYLESTMIEVRMKLDTCLRIDYPADYFRNLDKTEKIICLKLKEQLPALREALLAEEPEFTDFIDLKKYRKASFKIVSGLSTLERDYAIALMKGEDIHHLNAKILLEKIENYVPENIQESSPKYKIEEKIELDPETMQMVIEIGKYLQSHNIKLKELFKRSLYHSSVCIDGKYPFLINREDFFSLLQTEKLVEIVPPKFHEYCAVSAEESNIFDFKKIKQMINQYI